MLGTIGEYIVDSANTENNIVDLILQQEKNLGNEYLPNPFILKKVGIKSDSTCSILINKHVFNLSAGEPLEIGYNMMDVYKLQSQTVGPKLVIRYLY